MLDSRDDIEPRYKKNFTNLQRGSQLFISFFSECNYVCIYTHTYTYFNTQVHISLFTISAATQTTTNNVNKYSNMDKAKYHKLPYLV